MPASQSLLFPGKGILWSEAKDLCIRVALPQDRPAVVKVIDDVASEGSFLVTSQYYPTPQWEMLLNEGVNLSEGCLLLVAEMDRRIIGFARLFRDLHYFPCRESGNIGIALLPPFRSRGIGQLLLSQLIRCAPELGFRSLCAVSLSDNKVSHQFFLNQHFMLVKTIPKVVECGAVEISALLFLRLLKLRES